MFPILKQNIKENKIETLEILNKFDKINQKIIFEMNKATALAA